MPVAIRGVNFLSGGQSLEGAAARLNALNKAGGRAAKARRPGMGSWMTGELLMIFCLKTRNCYCSNFFLVGKQEVGLEVK